MIKQQRWNWHYNLECNASDSYLVCLDDVLDIRDTGNFDRFEFDYVGVIIGDEIIKNTYRMLMTRCQKWCIYIVLITP